MSKINTLRRTLFNYPFGGRGLIGKRRRSIINKKNHDTLLDKVGDL